MDSHTYTVSRDGTNSIDLIVGVQIGGLLPVAFSCDDEHATRVECRSGFAK
jgi:hypothetical protein